MTTRETAERHQHGVSTWTATNSTFCNRPKGAGNQNNGGWNVVVKKETRRNKQPWHKQWGKGWSWDAQHGWQRTGAWCCGACGEEHTNMSKQTCRKCGTKRPEQPEQPNQSALPAMNSLPKLGKQAQLAMQRTQPQEAQMQAAQQQNCQPSNMVAAMDTLESSASANAPAAHVAAEDLPLPPGVPDTEMSTVRAEAPDRETKRQQAMALLKELQLDAKLVKQVDEAAAVLPKEVEYDPQAARIQLAHREKALDKQRAMCHSSIDELRTRLQEYEDQLGRIEEELARVTKTRLELDAPSPEERARAQAEQQKQVTQHIDATLAHMRNAMLGNDWEAGAAAHQAAYDAWKQQQIENQLPCAPLGPWYVATILMPQLFNAMVHGQQTDASVATSAPEPQAVAAPAGTATMGQQVNESASKAGGLLPRLSTGNARRNRTNSEEPPGRGRSKTPRRSRMRMEQDIAAFSNPQWESA